MSGAVIVTGSDSGIGRADRDRAGARGASTSAITWHTDEAGAARPPHRPRARARDAEVARLDLTDRPGDAIEELAAELGELWGLVACAGANHRAGTLDDEPDAWRRALEVNLTGPFLCAQAAARRLVAGAARRAHRRSSPPCTSTRRCASPRRTRRPRPGWAWPRRSWRSSWRTFGITVNAVAPGHIATPMTGKAGVDPHTVALPPIPLGRPGAPGEVAATIAHLVSRAARVRDRQLVRRRRRAAADRGRCRCSAWSRAASERRAEPCACRDRRADRASALGLRALQAGPLLILVVLLVVMALLSPYFLTEPQPDQPRLPGVVRRGARARPAAGDHHARDRPVGRLGRSGSRASLAVGVHGERRRGRLRRCSSPPASRSASPTARCSSGAA